MGWKIYYKISYTAYLCGQKSLYWKEEWTNIFLLNGAQRGGTAKIDLYL